MKNHRLANLLASVLFLTISFAAVTHQAWAVSQFLTPEVNRVAASVLPGMRQVESGERADVVTDVKLVARNSAVVQSGVSGANVADSKAAGRLTVQSALRPVAKSAARPTPCAGYYGRIVIGGRTICLRSTGATGGALSYAYGYIYNSSAYRSWNQYIFAHNSTGLFGGLKNLGVGTWFSVTTDGKTRNYRISEKVTYCDYSNYANGAAGCQEAYPGSPVLDMYDVVRPGRQGADLALMTCAGTMLPGGDASHRLVVYAIEI